MRTSAKVALVLALVTAIAGFLVAGPYESHRDDPYSVTATVTPSQPGHFVVRVVIVDKRTSETVFHPTADLPANVTSEVWSDPVASKPQFHVRMTVDNQGRTNVSFEAFERLLQRSALTVATQQ